MLPLKKHFIIIVGILLLNFNYCFSQRDTLVANKHFIALNITHLHFTGNREIGFVPDKFYSPDYYVKVISNKYNRMPSLGINYLHYGKHFYFSIGSSLLYSNAKVNYIYTSNNNYNNSSDSIKVFFSYSPSPHEKKTINYGEVEGQINNLYLTVNLSLGVIIKKNYSFTFQYSLSKLGYSYLKGKANVNNLSYESTGVCKAPYYYYYKLSDEKHSEYMNEEIRGKVPLLTNYIYRSEFAINFSRRCMIGSEQFIFTLGLVRGKWASGIDVHGSYLRGYGFKYSIIYAFKQKNKLVHRKTKPKKEIKEDTQVWPFKNVD